MKPAAYRKGGAETEIRYGIGQSSLGRVLAAASERGICAIMLGDDDAGLIADLERRFPNARAIAADADFAATVGEVVAVVDAHEQDFGGAAADVEDKRVGDRGIEQRGQNAGGHRGRLVRWCARAPIRQRQLTLGPERLDSVVCQSGHTVWRWHGAMATYPREHLRRGGARDAIGILLNQTVHVVCRNA